MSNLKAQFTLDQATELLVEHFGHPENLISLAGGQASQAFSFTHSGRQLVLRVNTNQPYSKDIWAAKKFSESPVPVPAVVSCGVWDAFHWAISEKASGVALSDLDQDVTTALLPDLVQIMKVIHQTPVPEFIGYGNVIAETECSARSWRDHLRNGRNDDSFIKWEHVLTSASSQIRHLVERCWELTERYESFIPELHALNHGDFTFANVFSDGERITGVIDWGLVIGDPIWDVAWMDFWQTSPNVAEYWKRENPSDNSNERITCYQLHISAFALGFFLQTEQPILADAFCPRVEKIVLSAQP